MNLIERIKNLIVRKHKEQPTISSTDIVGYDTSLVYIPKYVELTAEEKAEVDRYIEETDTTKIENVILYGNNMNKYSKGITELLLNVAYRATGENETNRVDKLTTKDILNLRIDAMIATEEMHFYEAVLRGLEKEATLRTVALEQLYKKEKRNFRIFGVFEKAERIKRQNAEATFESAIERMRISKKIVEQQIQAVMNSQGSNEQLAQAIKAYTAMLKDRGIESQSKEILAGKKQELLEMAKVVVPEEVTDIREGTDEASEIKEIANLQGKLELYAYTHKEDIAQLRQRVSELDAIEKTDKNRDELLKKLSEIRIKYKVFGRYIKEEDLENLYKVKFDVLMSDINKRKESPLLGLSQGNEEFQYYKRIIESKIGEILTAQNPEVERAFGKEGVRRAITLIKKILKGENKTFEAEKILEDKTLLRLILAFDRENGLEKMTINKRETEVNLHKYMYEWEDIIPLKSIFQLRYEDKELKGEQIDSEDEKYIQLYNLYNEQHSMENYEERNEDYNFRTYIMPEGITELKKINDTYRRLLFVGIEYAHKLREYKKIILPSTLKKIEKGVFTDNQNLYEVEFNEGLEEIGDNAFSGCTNLGKYKSLKCPTSLKKIGSRAFYNCRNMAPIILNEGLTTIGDEAFNWNHYEFDLDERYTPATIIILPSSIKHVGSKIVDSTQVKKLGLKNYRGQEIPKEVLKIWYSMEGKVERTTLNYIYLFKGDSKEPYMRINPKKLIGVPNKSEALARMCNLEQER